MSQFLVLFCTSASLFSTEDSDIEDAGTDNEFDASTAIF